MWRNKLRMLIIFGVAMLFIFLGLEFKSVPINDRAFVLGIGIDRLEDKYELTCEILVPSKSAGGGSMNEDSHKILTGEGVDMAHALNDIFKKTGKLPSLGHCSVLILGDSVYDRDLMKELEFFIKSDSFRASVTVAVTEGAAKELMHTKTPLEKFTSLSLFEITSVYGKNTDAAATTLGDFREKTFSPSAASYLTLIKAVPAPKAESGDDGDSAAGSAEPPSEELVFYDCSSVAAFSDGRFSGFLTTEETLGLRLLEPKNNYESFRVRDENGNFSTVSLASKRVKSSVKLGSAPEVVYEITVKIKPAEAEDLNSTEGFVVSSRITEAMRQSVKEQIEARIHAARSKSVSLNSDVLFLANKFYARFGNAWNSYSSANPDYLAKINFVMKISVQ